MLPGLRELLAAAREGGRLVVHAREAHYPGLDDFETRKLPPHTLRGEFHARPFPGFEAAPGEPEIGKRRYSAFFATDLALLLREQGVDDVVITVGGTIPAEDVPELKKLGVAEVFTPGSSTQSIIDFIRDAVEQRG